MNLSSGLRLAALTIAMGPLTVAVAQYQVRVDFNDIAVGPQYNILGSQLFDGDTLYAIVRGIESDITPEWESQVVRVDNATTAPVATELVSYADWKALTGAGPADTILAGSRMVIIDGYLQFVDSNTDAVYRVDTQTGATSVFVSNEDIRTFTGLEEADILDIAAISPWNDMAIYDQDSDSVIEIAPDGTLTTLISSTEFTDFYGTTPVNNVAGGMTYDDLGVFYWTVSQSGTTGSAGGKIYKRDIDGTLSELMAAENIWDITLTFGNVAFSDLFYAPDGNLYFYDRDSDGILYFDPYDERLPWPIEEFMPNDLLFSYLSESQLMNGPAGTDFVGSFDSYEGLLVWNHIVAASPDVYSRQLAGTVILISDFNRDSLVNIADFDLFEADTTIAMGPGVDYDPSQSTLTPDARGVLPTDIDTDGDIDLADFAILQYQFGK